MLVKITKYSSLVGKTIIIKERKIEVIGYYRQRRISRTGRRYNRYYLQIRLQGYLDVLDVDIRLFYKRSFIKRLERISTHSAYLPVIYNPIRKSFLGETDKESFNYLLKQLEQCETPRALRKTYKQLIKYYHPDYLGRQLFPHEQVIFNLLREYKENMLSEFKELERICGINFDKVVSEDTAF